MQKINKKVAIKSYQKQHGLHHKINKNYGKVYWPYLPVLIISILGLSFGLFIAGFHQNSDTNSISYASLLASTNQYRIKNGLRPLNFNQNLSTAAQVQANKISISSSWSPLSSSQQPVFNLISKQSPNLTTPTENLAYDFSSSSSIVSAWSNNNYLSSNILNTHSNSVGFGIVNSSKFMGISNQKVVVAIFADNKFLPLSTISDTSQKSDNISSGIKSLAVIRLNVITKNDNIYELYAIAFFMLAIVTIIFSRHTYKFHKWITKGEKLAINHPIVDIVLVVVFIFLAGAIQTTGYIS